MLYISLLGNIKTLSLYSLHLIKKLGLLFESFLQSVNKVLKH